MVERTRKEPEPSPARRVRHVWIRPSATYGDLTPWPGVIVQWKHNGAEWAALVATVAFDGTLTVQWVESARIRPATSSTDGT